MYSFPHFLDSGIVLGGVELISSPRIQKQKNHPTQPKLYPALFTVHMGKYRAAGVQLENLIPNIAYAWPKLVSKCVVSPDIYQSPPARPIIMHVLFSVTYQIPVQPDRLFCDSYTAQGQRNYLC